MSNPKKSRHWRRIEMAYKATRMSAPPQHERRARVELEVSEASPARQLRGIGALEQTVRDAGVDRK
eukprot:4138034-Pyramimonas_sp.AAC.1